MIREFDMGDGVAGLALACEGSVNVLSKALNIELAERVDRLLNDPAVTGIVIGSDKTDFAAGGDLNGLLNAADAAEIAAIVAPFLATLRQLEKGGKPVVAALPGSALGGGLELSLACHHRIAADRTGVTLALPEVTLGLMPGGGGTQRLPRLIGLEAAAPMLLEGKTLDLPEALRCGLVDELVAADDLLPAAKRRVLAAAEATQPWDRRGFVMPGIVVQSQAGRQFFSHGWAGIARAKGGDPARLAILQAVYHGLQRGLDAGIAIETRHFAQLASAPSARNTIRTLFTGVGRAKAMKGRPAEPPTRTVRHLAVIGGGVMGRGIALVAAQAGAQVRLADVDLAAAQQAVDKILEQAARLEEKGRLRGTLARLKDAIVPARGLEDLADADFVVEAVFERLTLKQQILRDVAQIVRRDVPIASNTSTLPIGRLAAELDHPERVIGLHFFSPVDRMPLVEVVRANTTDSATLALALDFMKQLAKTPIVVNDGLGFYTSRVVTTYSSETMNLIAEGVPPQWIDNVAVAAGFAIGGASLVELTTYPLLRDILTSMRGDGTRPANAGSRAEEAVAQLLAANRIGKAAGGGLYDYGSESRSVWPGLATMFPAQGEPDADTLQQRLFSVQSLEAVRCLEDGVLAQPLDGDVAAVLGWGYPARLGGPFAYIDGIGTRRFVAACEALADRYGARFSPPQTLRDMAQTDTTFYS